MDSDDTSDVEAIGGRTVYSDSESIAAIAADAAHLPAAAAGAKRLAIVERACLALAHGPDSKSGLNESLRFALSPGHGQINAAAWLVLVVSCEEMYGRIGGLKFREGKLKEVLDACLLNPEIEVSGSRLGTPSEAAIQKGATYCSYRLMEIDPGGYKGCLLALSCLALTAGYSMENSVIEYCGQAIEKGFDINAKTKEHGMTALDYAEKGGFKRLSEWLVSQGGKSS